MLPVSLDVALGQPKVDDENFIGRLVQTHTEVVRLDITMYEMPVVDVLDPRDHLIDQHQDRLQGELPESFIKEILERRAHEIHNKHVVVTLIMLELPSVEQ